jgi:hypothetical protein
LFKPDPLYYAKSKNYLETLVNGVELKKKDNFLTTKDAMKSSSTFSVNEDESRF